METSEEDSNVPFRILTSTDIKIWLGMLDEFQELYLCELGNYTNKLLTQYQNDVLLL